MLSADNITTAGDSGATLQNALINGISARTLDAIYLMGERYPSSGPMAP